MTAQNPDYRDTVLDEVMFELQRQDSKWGEQNWPDGTGEIIYQGLRDEFRDLTYGAAENGHVTYRHILEEEVYEAFAESDLDRLRAELIQVAAVAVAWIEKLARDKKREGAA